MSSSRKKLPDGMRGKELKIYADEVDAQVQGVSPIGANTSGRDFQEDEVSGGLGGSEKKGSHLGARVSGFERTTKTSVKMSATPTRKTMKKVNEVEGKKNNSNGEIESTAVKKKEILSKIGSKNEFPSIVSQLSDTTRSLHKSILFDIFLQSSEKKLKSLAKNCGGISLNAVLQKTEEKRLGYSKNKIINYEAKFKSSHKNNGRLIGKKRARKDSVRDQTNESPWVTSEVYNLSPLKQVPKSLSDVVIALRKRGDVQHEQLKKGETVAPINSSKLGKKLKRDDYESLTKCELEEKVISKFRIKAATIKSLQKENQTYALYGESDKKTSEIDTRMNSIATPTDKIGENFKAISLSYNECSLAGFAKWAFLSADETDGLSTNKSPDVKTNKDSNLYFPSTTSLFHCCQICKRWGHYEVECDQLSETDPHNLLRVSKELKLQRKLEKPHTKYSENSIASQNGKRRRKSISPLRKLRKVSNPICNICKLTFVHVLSPKISCSNCGLFFHKGCIQNTLVTNGIEIDDEWSCSQCSDIEYPGNNLKDENNTVDVEGCEGFVIESRRRPTSKNRSFKNKGISNNSSFEADFLNNPWQKAMCIVNTKLLTSTVDTVLRKERARSSLTKESAPTSKEEDIYRSYVLKEGAICWAKREHAEIGKWARDEWWPARVIAKVHDDSRSIQYFKTTKVSPYLVKFLGMTKATRVRATAVLPYFLFFRNITYQTLSDLKKSNSEKSIAFRKGVVETMTHMGFKSIFGVLEKADNICADKMGGGNESKEVPRQKSPAKESKDERVIDFTQDDFIIHARASSKIKNVKEVKNEIKTVSAVNKFSVDKLHGSVVAWMSTSSDSRSKVVTTCIGTVLVVDFERKIALVQEIKNWKQEISRPKGNKILIREIATSAPLWKPVDKLHMVINGTDELSYRTFSDKIKAISSSREQSEQLEKDPWNKIAGLLTLDVTAISSNTLGM